METNSEILAARYAQALLCYAACTRDVNLVVRMGSFAAFLGLYRNRFARVEVDLYEKLAHIFSLDALRIDLLVKLLLSHGRLVLFSDVMRHLFELYKKQGQFLFCTIKASHELSVDQKEILATFVGRLSEKEIVFSVTIDRSLIAGVRIEGDEMVWESSVARQLRIIERLQ